MYNLTKNWANDNGRGCPCALCIHIGKSLYRWSKSNDIVYNMYE